MRSDHPKTADGCLSALLAELAAYVLFSVVIFPIVRFLAQLLGLSTASTGALILFSLATAFVVLAITHSLFVMYKRRRDQ
jgi:hypothetical protein